MEHWMSHRLIFARIWHFSLLFFGEFLQSGEKIPHFLLIRILLLRNIFVTPNPGERFRPAEVAGISLIFPFHHRKFLNTEKLFPLQIPVEFHLISYATLSYLDALSWQHTRGVRRFLPFLSSKMSWKMSEEYFQWTWWLSMRW